MALRMQIEKKKVKEEMRRLMIEKRKKVKVAKIENPLAKYNTAGQLTCVLCASIVKSEKVWQVHVKSKQHRDNVEQAKKLKELTNNFTVGKIKKRSSTPPPSEIVEKKLKGILKNAPTSVPVILQVPKNNAPVVISHHEEEIKRAPLNSIALANSNVKAGSSKENVEENECISELPSNSSDQPIPEGFFDDPIQDAKARNIEYKDPVEEEWEKFQKEIKEEATASAEIIAEEQEEATAERQIEEIDEQIRIWSRVLDLEVKKEETKKIKLETEQMDEDDDDDSETEIDEFFDWRAKES